MTIRYNDALLLAKTETTYGVDATPTAANDVVKALSVSLTAIEADETDRTLVGDGIGSNIKKLLGKRVKLDFTIELFASGVAGAAPKFGHILKAAGLAETADKAKKEVAYAPDITIRDSLTLAFQMGSNLHKLTGCRGVASLNLNAREVPSIKFTFTGLFVKPVAATALTGSADLSIWNDGMPITKQNTPVATLDGYNVQIESCSVEMGDTLVYVNRTNTEGVVRRDRNTTGSINVSGIAIADKNFWTKIEDETPVPFELVHALGRAK